VLLSDGANAHQLRGVSTDWMHAQFLPSLARRIVRLPLKRKKSCRCKTLLRNSLS
jgi:hypothetical protein